MPLFLLFHISYIQLELLAIQKLSLSIYFPIFFSHEIICGNITTTTSDHLPQFSFVPSILSNPSTQKSNFHEKDWSRFKQKNFILDHFDKDWADLLQIDQHNVNLSMNSSLNNMNPILDTHAPLKKFNKHKLDLRQNPGLLLPFRNLFLLETT